MQLRKLLRILNQIQKERGGHIEVNIQAQDFKNSPWDYHSVNTVGISEYFKEDDYGFPRDNPTIGVSLGLESSNIKEYK